MSRVGLFLAGLAFLSAGAACSSSQVADEAAPIADTGAAAPGQTNSGPGSIVAVTEDGEILNRVRLVVGTISITQI